MKEADEVYVSIEKYIPEENIVLFDFYDSNEFTYFNTLLGTERSIEQPSMVLIKGYKLRKVREGSKYIIDGKTIRQIREVALHSTVEDSFLIGYEITLTDDITEFFTKSKTFSPFVKHIRREDQSTHNNIEDLDIDQTGKISVIVRNVGQGSWNEVYVDDKICLVFDIGTIYHTKKSVMQAIIGNKDLDYKKDKPICIISHWDVDHYHFLLSLTDETIRSFSKFICRGILPNLTSRIIFSRIQALNPTAIRALLAEPAPSGTKYSTILKCINPTNPKYLLYNGSVNNSRNKGGICMAIRTSEKSIILAADMDYGQISDHVLPDLNYPNDHYLVVPHHGGNAGNFIYKTGTNLRPKEAIVSVGRNSYGHPKRKYLTDLKNLKFTVRQTRMTGTDIKIV